MSYAPNKHPPPKPVETQYGILAKPHAKDLDIPSDHEFEEKVKQAMNVKDKFSLLKDVKPDRFYNILGEVIKVHDVSSASVTVYLSDYTENSQFYNNASGADGADSEARDGDEFGYTKSKTKKTANSWPGPYGKRSIQLTLYDGHADFVRENVKVKQWVLLSNVQIKYGKMGGVLEGYLRGDRESFEGQVRVQIMEQAEKPEDNDDRWREAVQRQLEYKRKQEKQNLGSKRKHDDAEPKNSKERRNVKRAATEKKVAELSTKAKKKVAELATKAKEKEKPDLNENSE
jgi:protection-of-telomeres protein 1